MGNFGDISIIMTGDSGQLHSVRGGALHTTSPNDQFNQGGFLAYRSFTSVTILKNVQRQTAVDMGGDNQKVFLDLLPRSRDGRLTQYYCCFLLKHNHHTQTLKSKSRTRNLHSTRRLR